jgi:hypothetical protein
MHVMQYEIEIPAGYDIRNRVQTRGAATDDFAGLGLKAYCITATHYAPFYFWRDPAGMNRFLFGNGGFQHIVNDFGRPPVRNWLGVAFRRGRADTARTATRRTFPFPPHSEIPDLTERPGLYASATGIDPDGWRLVQFSLWEDEAPDEAGQKYEVLHLSVPELDKL